MRKILIFSTSYLPNIGGAEVAIKSITDRLPESKFYIITGMYDKALPREEEIGNAKVFRVGSRSHFHFILPKALLPIAMFWKARQLSTEINGFDAIFSSQASQAGGAAWLLKKFQSKIPLVVNVQEGKDLDKQNFIVRFSRKMILQEADLITVISDYLGKAVIDMGISKDKIYKIPNGVDISKFSNEISYGESNSLKESLGIKPGEKVIISTSRLVFKNGMDTLIESMKFLPNEYKLILIGDGPDKESLKDLSWHQAVHKRVIFVGKIDHSELYKYLKISHVFARPARSEGLGNSFLEAMAAGIPVVGTPVGGIPEFLKHRETGMMAEPGNAKSVAQSIEKLCSDQKLREDISTKAFKILDNFSWDIIAAQYSDLFRRLIV